MFSKKENWRKKVICKFCIILYLSTNLHLSFSDDNNRIAAMLFLWFMENNGILYGENGRKRIADNTNIDDCRESHQGKGCDSEGGSEFDKQGE